MTTMKCVTASEFGKVDDVLSMENEWPQPKLEPGSKDVIVRVLACSLSPACTRMLDGSVDKFLHPSSFPYIPGMDICGIVEEVGDGGSEFKVGDRIVSSNGTMPVGGLAEYAIVKESSYAAIVPKSIDATEAAAIPCSYITAMQAVKSSNIKDGYRVLVLGGSGGVGTALVQLVRNAGASFIATTSTDAKLMKSLDADTVIDYTKTNWWEVPEFKDEKFDVIFDCVGKDQDKYKSVLKTGRQGGLFLAISIKQDMEAHTTYQAMKHMMPAMCKHMWTSVWRFAPRYKFFLSLHPEKGELAELLQLVVLKKLKIALEPNSPYEFTIDGVKKAFSLQASNHAHGKVVVKM